MFAGTDGYATEARSSRADSTRIDSGEGKKVAHVAGMLAPTLGSLPDATISPAGRNGRGDRGGAGGAAGSKLPLAVPST